MKPETLNLPRGQFLDLKQRLAEQLPAGLVSKADAIEQLIAAGWDKPMAIDFVGFCLNGTAE